MKIVKTLATAVVMLTLSSCATIFYNKSPSLQKAPLACGVDIIFGWTFVPLLVDTLYGACYVEGLKR
jgi:hypothetical protein